MTADDTRRELKNIMFKVPEFKESTRTCFLYSADGAKGEKVKVRFDKNNFKVMVGEFEFKLQSVPLSKVKVDKVEAYLKAVLARY